MPYHPAPAPDAVLDRILRESVKRGNIDLPLELFLVLGLGRDATADELRRCQALVDAGHRRVCEQLAAAQIELAIAEAREAAEAQPTDS